MKRRLITIFFLCALLSGCKVVQVPPPPPAPPQEAMVFGVPQSQWDKLNAQQKNEVIKGYNKQALVAEKAQAAATLAAEQNQAAAEKDQAVEALSDAASEVIETAITSKN